ncbi:MAG: hypothetical protein ACRYGK_04410 [Janthinobacterium lividum]
MALKFKKGDAVRQVVKPITGTVTDIQIVDSDVSYIVAYEDGDGEPHQVVLTESQLEAGQ